jgi:hypothetical protein
VPPIVEKLKVLARAGEIRSGIPMTEPGRDRSPLAAAVTASPMGPKESSSYSCNLAASLI